MKFGDIIKFGIDITCPDINSRGSGFIVRKDGLVGTNWHVVHDNQNGSQSQEIAVRLYGEEEFQATVLDTNQRKDFAILKIEHNFDSEPDFGDFSSVEPFEEVFFVGRGLEVPSISLHRGWISAKTQKDDVDVLQIDGPINQGNSGGALFNTESRVIGIITETEAKFDTGLQALIKLIPQIQGSMIMFGIDLPETLRRIIVSLDRNRNVGIGYAFSIDYLKESLKNL